MNAHGEVPIFIRITVNGQRQEFLSKQWIDSKLWDSRKGRVKGNKEEARVINLHLDHIRTRLNSIYNELEKKGELITASVLKEIFLGKVTNRRTLVQAFQYHNRQMEAQIGKGYARTTYTKFLTTLKLTEEFIQHQYKKDDLFFSELRYQFITEFELYLKTVRSCAHNTAMKYLINFRKIINMAVVNEWIDKDPFAKFKGSKLEVKRDFLSEEELESISNKTFPMSRLNLVKDTFLFCCYTGLAYVDVANLTPDHIASGIDGEQWLFIDRQKTGSSSHVPLLPPALSIIEKYKDHPEAKNKGILLPVISNQKLNAYLKEIADVCNIKKHLTFHVARHTFATTVTLTNGIPIESVSAMLGHKSIKTTQIYAKVVQKKVSEDMKVLKNKYSSENKEILDAFDQSIKL
jgi:site-specific recombinase XerD